MWLSFENGDEDYFRLGVNPHGAYKLDIKCEKGGMMGEKKETGRMMGGHHHHHAMDFK